jgi:hypothetical protein
LIHYLRPMTEPQAHVSIKQTVVPVRDVPFQGDLFERKLLAQKLEQFVSALHEGGAISIDSPWGSGKTWFARNWERSLRADSYEVLYIDAFKMDYLEDPFLLIAGELLSLAKGEETKRALLEAGARLGKIILPTLGKLAVATAANFAFGEAGMNVLGDAADKVIDKASEAAQKEVEKKLEDYQNEKKTAAAFKERLQDLAKNRSKPIIVLIDELDRCRPDFAVKTLERIKHFFEVPGIVFVLLVNRSQLHASIRGAYGQDIDADAYLRKFLLFSLLLPKWSQQGDMNHRYAAEVLKEFGLQDTAGVRTFAEQFGALATHLNLQLRDVERACALFALGQPINLSAAFAAWLVAVKLWRPDLYARIAAQDATVYVDLNTAWHASQKPFDSFIAPIALELLGAHKRDFKPPIPAETLHALRGMFPDLTPSRILPFMVNKLDLGVA